MFDWYPIISKGETFIELFQEAFYWSFWHHPFLWIVVFISVFKSKHITSVFHRKIIASSFLAFIPVLLISLSLLAIMNGDKPSNSLLYGTIFSIPVFAFCLILFIQSSRLNTSVQKKESQSQLENFGSRFQELPVAYQIFFLVLMFFLIFSFSFLFTISIWRFYVLFFTVLTLSPYLFFLHHKMKKLQGIKMAFKSSDYIPVLILLLVFISISTITVGDFICAIPKFNCYFSCCACK